MTIERQSGAVPEPHESGPAAVSVPAGTTLLSCRYPSSPTGWAMSADGHPAAASGGDDRSRRQTLWTLLGLTVLIALVVVQAGVGDSSPGAEPLAPAGDDSARPAGPEARATGSGDGGALAAADDPTGVRDPWLRPFSSTSIWNMPIGSDANYVAADLPYTPRHELERSYLIRTSADDPSRSIIRTGSWRDRCSGTQISSRTLHLPDGWAPRPVVGRSTPNNPGVFLQPDGRTLVNVGAMARCEADGPLYAQWPREEKHITDLYGDGIYGAHGASKLSQLGGAIRPGELSGEVPIQHALDLLIWSEHLYWGGSTASSYRWPASGSDAYAGPSRYRGTNPELRMGSLLALPPDATPEALGITSDVGRRLFGALQDYGAYVTDDSAWDATYIGVDDQAVGTFPWGDQERADMAAMVSALQVVANNGPQSIGGGGVPRQPLLPELVDPAELALSEEQVVAPSVPAADDAALPTNPTSEATGILAAASFDGPDGSALDASGGLDWNVLSGVWQQRSGAAMATGGTGPMVAAVDVGTSDVSVSATITLSGERAAPGLATRVIDSRNLLLVSLVRRNNADAVELYIIRNGRYELLSTVTGAGLQLGTSYDVSVHAVGSTITVDLDGVTVIEHTISQNDATRLAAGTSHGLRTTLTDRTDDGSSRWDDFMIVKPSEEEE